MVVQKKRKISNGLQSSAQADQISHTQSKEDAATMVSEYTISEKSPRSVTNTNPHPTLLPSRRLDRSDKLVSSCHLERNPGFGEDRVVKDNIQDINDVTSVKQKPSRRVKLNEAGNIYRKQVRSLFDFSMEKYVAPFMIEFEGFLETELNLEGKKIIFQKTFKDRLYTFDT
ncbi:hypothetical protein DFH28DRAFT_218722 [Melampsora americana]|nr:hypothetical protein DFH28DRAFT_218722 [Melampsora americana]